MPLEEQVASLQRDVERWKVEGGLLMARVDEAEKEAEGLRVTLEVEKAKVERAEAERDAAYARGQAAYADKGASDTSCDAMRSERDAALRKVEVLRGERDAGLRREEAARVFIATLCGERDAAVCRLEKERDDAIEMGEAASSRLEAAERELICNVAEVNRLGSELDDVTSTLEHCSHDMREEREERKRCEMLFADAAAQNSRQAALLGTVEKTLGWGDDGTGVVLEVMSIVRGLEEEQNLMREVLDDVYSALEEAGRDVCELEACRGELEVELEEERAERKKQIEAMQERLDNFSPDERARNQMG